MKFNENCRKGSGDMEPTRNSRPSPVTLTLSLGSSAHCLTKRNIWVKFSENQQKGSGDMEQTLNSKVNPLTLTCDLEST